MSFFSKVEQFKNRPIIKYLTIMEEDDKHVLYVTFEGFAKEKKFFRNKKENKTIKILGSYSELSKSYQILGKKKTLLNVGEVVIALTKDGRVFVKSVDEKYFRICYNLDALKHLEVNGASVVGVVK